MALFFLAETIVAHRMAPSPWSPMIWLVLSATALAAFGAEFHHPVRGEDHVGVVFDHDERRARVTETSEQGKFGWVLDPEGNKIELWEPPAGQ